MKIAILWVLLNIFVISVLANGTRADQIETASSIPKANLIIVSTIDGHLIALDAETGKQKWSFKEDPVINSPRDALTGFTFIPNPRDGQLYSLEDGDLGKLPYTIPQLVKGSPSRTANGILYAGIDFAGTKKDIWISINPETGSKIETLRPLSPNSFCPIDHPETIFIGRTEYHLSMLDTNNKERKWNASFTDYSSHLLPPESEYPFQHFTLSNDGKIMTIEASSGKMIWKKDFQGVIVNLYLLKSDGLHLLPSHTIGKKVFDAIAEDVELASEFNYLEPAYHTYTAPNFVPETIEKASNGRFRASLYIGETISGLFAMPSIISTTGREIPKLLGPKIVDRLEPQLSININENKPLVPRIQLPPNVPTSMTTYKTVEGEYFLLGYHTYPRLVMKESIQFTDPPNIYFPPRYRIEYDETERDSNIILVKPSKNRQLSGKGQMKRIGYDKEKEDPSLLELLGVFWDSHPRWMLAISSTVVALMFATIYMCGRQSGFNYSTSISQHSREASHASQRSRAYSTEASSNPISKFFSRSSKSSAVIEDDDFDPLIPPGWRQVGKIQYNPNAILGQGCGGTVVYRGSFDGREAAVKRVLNEHVMFIDREIDLLRESDTHLNVVRYFCSEQDHNFRFIALELCECTLKDYVTKSKVQKEFEGVPKVDILRQATDGLLHLHNNKIIHRDIKPHNILLSRTSTGTLRVMISDFGLCKKMRPDAASISRVSGLVGTQGWQAPEFHLNQSITFAVDVFSMGCIYFYVLTNGKHPFGDEFRQQENIVNGEYHLGELLAIDTSFNIAAVNLIEQMLQLISTLRPRFAVILSHPMFWTKDKQLQFFMDVSDRVEKEEEANDVVQSLERYGVRVSKNWQNEICNHLREDLRKFRSYRPNSVRDLLRALRNKKHHYRELPPLVKESLGDIPNGYVDYWTSRFPRLLMHMYNAMVLCREESAFATYYPPEAQSFCNRMLEDELNSDFVIAGPGTYLKHTTSTPALHGSPRHQRSSNTTLSSVDDNWRGPSPKGAPSSAAAAKKLKKKKAQEKKKKENEKAPFSVLEQLEESGDDELHENGSGSSPGDDNIIVDSRENTPSA